MNRVLVCLLLLIGLSCRSTRPAESRDIDSLHLSLSSGAAELGSWTVQVADAKLAEDTIHLDQVKISIPGGRVVTALHGTLSSEVGQWHMTLAGARSVDANGTIVEAESMSITVPKDTE